MAVFVLDKHKKPLMPCSEKRARLLLQRKKAVVHKMEPFTIRLKERTLEQSELQPLRKKIDPGSKTTGISIIRDDKDAIVLGEIHHKTTIKDSLGKRSSIRRNRRNRNTRYRKCRYENRKTKLRDCKICRKNTPKRRNKRGEATGGRESLCTPCRLKTKEPNKIAERTKRLPPSLVARVNQTVQAVKKHQKLCPLTHISFELVKFDPQLMLDGSIKGIEYQQGTLHGYTIREYLLEKWNRQCAYCNISGVPLEIEHVVPRSKKGSNKISNLAIACRECNEEKDNMYLDEWAEKLSKKNDKRSQIILKNIPSVKSQLTVSLRDAAMMNAARWKLFEELKKINLPLETGSGALTKMNRIQHGLPKEHYYDAVCVGNATPSKINIKTKYVYLWKAEGRGNRQMARVDQFGFPLCHLEGQKYDKKGKRKGHKERNKTCKGFQTGDIVVAKVTEGKKIGVYRGRVAIRHTGSFNIKDIYTNATIQGISFKYCKVIQKGNGWSYQKTRRVPPHV